MRSVCNFSTWVRNGYPPTYHTEASLLIFTPANVQFIFIGKTFQSWMEEYTEKHKGTRGETSASEGEQVKCLQSTSGLIRTNPHFTSPLRQSGVSAIRFAKWNVFSALLLTQHVTQWSFIGKTCAKCLQSSKEETTYLFHSLQSNQQCGARASGLMRWRRGHPRLLVVNFQSSKQQS